MISFDDLLVNYKEKMEIIENQDMKIIDLQQEIERLTISLQAQEELTMNEHIKVERLNNIINRIKSIYSSLCFSAPENDYIFINKLGEVLEEIKDNEKEEQYNTNEEQQDYLWEQINEDNIELEQY